MSIPAYLGRVPFSQKKYKKFKTQKINGKRSIDILHEGGRCVIPALLTDM